MPLLARGCFEQKAARSADSHLEVAVGIFVVSNPYVLTTIAIALVLTV